MVFSSLILILNFGLGGVLLVLSTMMSDMCYSDPAANFETVVDEAGVEFPDGAPDPFWWAKCEGTNPMQTVLDGFKTPLTALVDQIYTPCAAGTTPCTVAGQCDTDKLAAFLDPALVEDNAYTAKMQKTVFDFTELFMCEKLNKVVAGIMYDGVCEGLINTFFFLWAALTASSFFIILAFYLLACKAPSGDDDEEDEDDTKNFHFAFETPNHFASTATPANRPPRGQPRPVKSPWCIRVSRKRVAIGFVFGRREPVFGPDV